ncbi:efflux RND transporter periplasmic adaptor subunit [Sphingobacterium spiritivorum]|uniref:efflux RND transporter periplasmic adaptor subunit n=1 Tax=Sphingobacterium spiritivorum TaxID=258 RepID=UPI003DA358B5
MVKQEFIFRSTFNRLIPIAALVFILGSCTGNQQEENYGEQAVDADFITLETGTTNLIKTYPGTIEGTVNVDVRAQVSGYLETIFVQEGDYVSKGQALFKIKGDVFSEQVNNSEASLKAAIAAQANARIELDKIRPLVQGKVVSELQLQTAQAQYDAATAQVAQARAALGSSRINADFAVIKAPVSGYIGRIPNRVGNLVTPADASPLTTLSEINNVFVYFSLSEAEFIDFTKARKKDEGMNTVEIVMADGTVYGHKGRVEVASGNIDRATGSIALKAVFPNPDRVLRSGGAGRIILTRKIDEAISIPMASVKDIQDRFFVFALTDSSKVAMRPIEISGRSGQNYIVRSGVKPGDKIAVNRIDMLAEGVKVAPVTVAADSLAH